jgi:hypothetical protein
VNVAVLDFVVAALCVYCTDTASNNGVNQTLGRRMRKMFSSQESFHVVATRQDGW